MTRTRTIGVTWDAETGIEVKALENVLCCFDPDQYVNVTINNHDNCTLVVCDDYFSTKNAKDIVDYEVEQGMNGVELVNPANRYKRDELNQIIIKKNHLIEELKEKISEGERRIQIQDEKIREALIEASQGSYDLFKCLERTRSLINAELLTYGTTYQQRNGFYAVLSEMIKKCLDDNRVYFIDDTLF